MKLQKNLKRLRAKRKLSQQRVADINGLTRSSYSGYENGVCEPNICTLLKLSKFYKVTIEKLVQ